MGEKKFSSFLFRFCCVFFVRSFVRCSPSCAEKDRKIDEGKKKKKKKIQSSAKSSGWSHAWFLFLFYFIYFFLFTHPTFIFCWFCSRLTGRELWKLFRKCLFFLFFTFVLFLFFYSIEEWRKITLLLLLLLYVSSFNKKYFMYSFIGLISPFLFFFPQLIRLLIFLGCFSFIR